MHAPLRSVLATAACAVAFTSIGPARAASFGNICEGTLYAGAAFPLFYAGAIAGVGAAVVGGYTLFDMGEAFYVGFRESNAALQGNDPREVGGVRAGAIADGSWNTWLVSRPAVPDDAERWFADLAYDPRLQLGGADVDVVGMRLGILSAENRNVMGLDVCTLLGRTLGDEYALQAGLFNLVDGRVGGLQAGLANLSGRSLYGIQAAGFFNVAGGDAPSYGIQAAGFANRAHDLFGVQIGYVDVADVLGGLQAGGYAEADRAAGAQVAIVCRADELEGLQIGVANVCLDLDDPSKAGDMSGAQLGLVNVCNRGTGLQLGLWNHAKSFAGVQIGLVNVIEDHEVPFLPIFNAGF